MIKKPDHTLIYKGYTIHALMYTRYDQRVDGSFVQATYMQYSLKGSKRVFNNLKQCQKHIEYKLIRKYSVSKLKKELKATLKKIYQHEDVITDLHKKGNELEDILYFL